MSGLALTESYIVKDDSLTHCGKSGVIGDLGHIVKAQPVLRLEVVGGLGHILGALTCG